MEYKIKVIGYLKCKVGCPVNNDDRCCLTCGVDVMYCTSACKFISDTIKEGQEIGKDYIKENCSECIKQ